MTWALYLLCALSTGLLTWGLFRHAQDLERGARRPWIVKIEDPATKVAIYCIYDLAWLGVVAYTLATLGLVFMGEKLLEGVPQDLLILALDLALISFLYCQLMVKWQSSSSLLVPIVVSLLAGVLGSSSVVEGREWLLTELSRVIVYGDIELSRDWALLTKGVWRAYYLAGALSLSLILRFSKKLDEEDKDRSLGTLLYSMIFTAMAISVWSQSAPIGGWDFLTPWALKASTFLFGICLIWIFMGPFIAWHWAKHGPFTEDGIRESTVGGRLSKVDRKSSPGKTNEAEEGRAG